MLARQVLRSSTSVAANYRATGQARSKPEFIAKLAVVLEEADETVFWLEMLGDSGVIKSTMLTVFVAGGQPTRSHIWSLSSDG